MYNSSNEYFNWKQLDVSVRLGYLVLIFVTIARLASISKGNLSTKVRFVQQPSTNKANASTVPIPDISKSIMKLQTFVLNSHTEKRNEQTDLVEHNEPSKRKMVVQGLEDSTGADLSPKERQTETVALMESFYNFGVLVLLRPVDVLQKVSRFRKQ
ncbi:hypothetical protein N431DRAFT_448082 [Stipitochalara longipes BDJ]|nr:hypothetical protein N431DRAFT_448082 [Stipitochalara longipes BDJ]